MGPPAGLGVTPAAAEERYPALVRGLLRPEAYSHAADDLRVEETHASWVVLSGPFAYKIKKPVDFGFLDFSTLERRSADCEAEVRLNRRLAPAVYLGVVDIVERDGAIRVGGPGWLLERAVWMRRLPDEGMLSALLARDAVPIGLLRRIARIIADFHATAPTGPGVDEHGALSAIESHWRESFRQMAPFIDVTIPAWELEAIRRTVEGTLHGQADLFDRRVAEGRIRDGHGDLHAGSICLVGKQVIVFDCLEFSPVYRCSDVAAEVAFLAMDLDHAGRADLGWSFVSEYVRRSGDSEILQLLDFYKAYRAFVRGKVRSLRLLGGALAGADRAAIMADARAYFDLAATHAGGFFRPTLVVMTGLPGSGKTTLAQQLARRLGMVHLSTDVVRKRRAGLRPTDRADTRFAHGLYAPEVTRQTYRALRQHAATWLRRSVSVVLDGTFGDPRERRLCRGLASRAGAGFLVVHAAADDPTLRRQIEARERDRLRVSDATWEIVRELRGAFTAPTEIPPAELVLGGAGGADAIIERLVAPVRTEWLSRGPP